MLHAPDFLGYAGAVELARDAPAAVERGLALKKTGQRGDRRSSAGARSTRSTSASAASTARRPGASCGARRAARAGARGGARDGALDGRASTSPSARVECELVALSEPGEYAIERGRIVSDRRPRHRGRASTTSTSSRSTSSTRTRSTRGCATAAPTCAARSRASRSTATGSRRSRARRRARPGSSRRAATRSAASSCAASSSSYACDEALRLIDGLRGAGRARPSRSSPSRASATARREAPRGLLYHRYRLDADGTILDAKIVPPTSQNQLAIEDDLRARRRRATPTLPDDELPGASASRRSATTTRASRARRTSST